MHTFLRPRRLAGSRGFTLVELMVVLLIVGVLVALGLAKFAPATGAAKTTKAKTALKRAAEDAQAYYAVGRTMDGLAEGDLEDVRVNEIVDQSADPATSSAEDCTPENLNASVTAAIGTLHYCAHGDVFAAITGAPNGTIGSAGIGGVSPLGAIRSQAAGELDVWGIRSTETAVEPPSKLGGGDSVSAATLTRNGETGVYHLSIAGPGAVGGRAEGTEVEFYVYGSGSSDLVADTAVGDEGIADAGVEVDLGIPEYCGEAGYLVVEVYDMSDWSLINSYSISVPCQLPSAVEPTISSTLLSKDSDNVYTLTMTGSDFGGIAQVNVYDGDDITALVGQFGTNMDMFRTFDASANGSGLTVKMRANSDYCTGQTLDHVTLLDSYSRVVGTVDVSGQEVPCQNAVSPTIDDVTITRLTNFPTDTYSMTVTGSRLDLVKTVGLQKWSSILVLYSADTTCPPGGYCRQNSVEVNEAGTSLTISGAQFSSDVINWAFYNNGGSFLAYPKTNNMQAAYSFQSCGQFWNSCTYNNGYTINHAPNTGRGV